MTIAAAHKAPLPRRLLSSHVAGSDPPGRQKREGNSVYAYLQLCSCQTHGRTQWHVYFSRYMVARFILQNAFEIGKLKTRIIS